MPDVINYTQAPLGSLSGESHLQSPFNRTSEQVVVRVRNLSAIRPRRIVKEYVSIRRGGKEQLNNRQRQAEFGGQTSPDQLQYRVAQGDNMNWTDVRVAPIDFMVRHDNRQYRIPAVDPKTGENAPWVTVDPGCWDLYMGNWQRMHSTDPQVKTNEMISLQGRGLNKWVVDLSVDPKEHPEDVEYGLLEFEREEIKIETASVDAAAVNRGLLIEV